METELNVDANFILTTLLTSKEIRFSSDGYLNGSQKLSIGYIKQILEYIKKEKGHFISFAQAPYLNENNYGLYAKLIESRKDEIKQFLDNGGFKNEPKEELSKLLNTANISIHPSFITGKSQNITHIDNSTHIHAPNSNIAHSVEGNAKIDISKPLESPVKETNKADEKPKVEKWIYSIKNHPIGATVIIIATIIAGIASFKKDIMDLFQTKKETPTIINAVLDSNLYKKIYLPKEEPYIETQYLAKPDPLEIVESISRLPPYQKMESTLNYIGLKINWVLNFKDIKHREYYNSLPSEFRLYLSCDSLDKNDHEMLAFIVCNININEYPQLKITKYDAIIKIKGIIESIDNNIINLEKPIITSIENPINKVDK